MWYLSKEVVAVGDRGNGTVVRQIFSCYAKLALAGDAPADSYCYPSQTSILTRGGGGGGEGWQSLSAALPLHADQRPPVVELL